MDLKSLKESICERFKLTGKQAAYIAAAVIAALMLIIMGRGGQETDISGAFQETVPEVSSEYEKALTEELEAIISEIKGVGNVSVMVTIEGSSSYVYEKDVEKADMETKAETVIIGNKEALIKRIDNPKVKGVLVVCSGGDSINVKEKVINAVSTVLNISSSRVYVTKSN